MEFNQRFHKPLVEMGDFNTKSRSANTDWENIMGTEGVGLRND